EPYGICVPKRLQGRSGRSIRRQRRRAPWDERLGCGFVVLRQAHHSIRFSGGVAAVDLVRGDVSIPIQESGRARSAGAAVLNRVLVAVQLNVLPCRRISAGRQSEVVGPPVPQTGDLPAADELVDHASGVSAELLAATE